MRDQLRVTEEEFEVKSSALHEAERALADKQADLAKIVAELGERSIMADSQRVELAALRTQIEAMKVSVADYERAVRATEERLARERAEAEAAAKQSGDERSKLDGLTVRAGELERQLLVQKTEAEVMSRRVKSWKSGSASRGGCWRSAISCSRGCAATSKPRTRSKATCAKRSRMPAAAPAAPSTNSAPISSQLEAQLATAIDERTKLQREIAAMKRDAETTWAAERVENALLRERINDVAAEVARLTAVLEGPGSPIETMLAEAIPDGPRRAERRPASTAQAAKQATPRSRRRRTTKAARRPHSRPADDRLARGVELMSVTPRLSRRAITRTCHLA